VILFGKLLMACGGGALGLFVVLLLFVALFEAWAQSWLDFTVAVVLISTVMGLPVGIWLQTR
jgi:ABC-type proline/glycine betaine transport system permease subunit